MMSTASTATESIEGFCEKLGLSGAAGLNAGLSDPTSGLNGALGVSPVEGLNAGFGETGKGVAVSVVNGPAWVLDGLWL